MSAENKLTPNGDTQLLEQKKTQTHTQTHLLANPPYWKRKQLRKKLKDPKGSNKQLIHLEPPPQHIPMSSSRHQNSGCPLDTGSLFNNNKKPFKAPLLHTPPLDPKCPWKMKIVSPKDVGETTLKRLQETWVPIHQSGYARSFRRNTLRRRFGRFCFKINTSKSAQLPFFSSSTRRSVQGTNMEPTYPWRIHWTNGRFAYMNRWCLWYICI